MEDAVDQDLVVQYPHAWAALSRTTPFDEQAADTVGTTASDYREIESRRGVLGMQGRADRG